MTSLVDFKHQKGGVALPSQRLSAVLDLLGQFFNADGNGLSYEEMESETHNVSTPHDSHVTLM